MVNSIIEALNETTDKGIYVLHKYIKPTLIKSVDKVTYDLYLINNENKLNIFSYSRTKNTAECEDTFFTEFNKSFTKELIIKIIKGEV